MKVSIIANLRIINVDISQNEVYNKKIVMNDMF